MPDRTRLVHMYDQYQYGKQQYTSESLSARIVPLKEVIARTQAQLVKEENKAREQRDKQPPKLGSERIRPSKSRISRIASGVKTSPPAGVASAESGPRHTHVPIG